MFPNARFITPDFRSDAQAAAIERDSVNVRPCWRASTGGWFIADDVVGKHDFIPFALGLDQSGIVGVEILEYRESYGDQVRDPGWRGQFIGKARGEKTDAYRHIGNISGATLSCRHMSPWG